MRLTCSADAPFLPIVRALRWARLLKPLVTAAVQFFAVSMKPGSLGCFFELLTTRTMRCSNPGRCAARHCWSNSSSLKCGSEIRVEPVAMLNSRRQRAHPDSRR